MKTYWIIGIAIVLLVAGMSVWTGQQRAALNAMPLQQGSTGNPTPENGMGTSSSSQPSPESNAAQSATSTPSPSEKYIVHVSDSGADMTRILTMRGDVVQITFEVNASGTYHGGLEFRSPIVSTGPIPPGNSKTITFTASQPFAFTPYWPATNIQKAYKIAVGVGIPN